MEFNSGIETWQTIKKNRYENHIGHLCVRNMEKLLSNSRMERHHSSKISVCSNDMDDEEKMVLDWSRQNNSFAMGMERDLKDQFEQVVKSLDAYVKCEQTEPGPHSGMYNLGSLSSVNRSNLSLGLGRFDSNSTLTEVQSVATIENPEKSRKLSRLTERLRAASITTDYSAKPKVNTEAKKMVFVPSGFERDILEFHKFNQI